MVYRGNLNTLRMYSLRTGKVHSLAHSHDIRFQILGLGLQWSLSIKIHGRHLGIMNIYLEEGPVEFRVFDWINGDCILVREANLNWTLLTSHALLIIYQATLYS